MFKGTTTYIRLLFEELRVRSHLQRTEMALRYRDVSQLPPSIQLARQQRLDALDHYWRFERIPRNFKYDQRIPCFIDRTGGRCAVAHLVIESGFGDVAQTVAMQANDAYLLDMNFPELGSWAKQNGFTKDELARIQPSYCPTPEDAQLVTTTGIIYFVSLLVMVAGTPSTLWNLFKGHRRDLANRLAVNAGAIIGLLLFLFATVIAMMIASGNEVTSDLRTINTSYGFNETCEEAAERLVGRISYTYSLLLVVVGSIYIGSARWRVFRGRHSQVITNEESTPQPHSG